MNLKRIRRIRRMRRFAGSGIGVEERGGGPVKSATLCLQGTNRSKESSHEEGEMSHLLPMEFQWRFIGST